MSQKKFNDQTKEIKSLPKIDKVLFGDTNFSKIDWQKNAGEVISRVMMRGNIKDWIVIRDYYGLERIKEEMLKVRYLDKKTLYFLSSFYNIPKEKFRCYNWQESIPKSFNW